MSVSRKDFLKVMVTGGLGVCFGGASAVPKFLKEKGAGLITVSRQSLVMGSVATFEVLAESEQAGYDAIRKGVQVFRSIDQKLSMYRQDSEMAGLEKSAGYEAVRISDDARRVLNYAVGTSELSQGLFDVTIEPAMRLWGFRNEPGVNIEEPTESELKKMEKLIGSNKITLEGNSAFLEEQGMGIDVGGIAGGYALDRAIEEMKKCDISAAFINFSGDIHCFGEPLDGKAWKVHILDPETRQPLSEVIELKNRALSTSGAYENRRHSSKRSWGHLLHPNSVKPVETENSMTAIHTSAMTADAWSTAAYLGAAPPDDVKTIVV